MTPGERSGVAQTGDLLRPVRSRPSGTRAIAWYGVIGVLATVAIVYLVGIFAAPAHEDPAPSSLLGQAGSRSSVSGDDAFRYSGRVVDDRQRAGARGVPGAAAARGARDAAPGPRVQPQPRAVVPVASSAPPIAAASDDGASTVLAHTAEDVPDVSDAVAGRVRLRLPTPAPDDAAPQRSNGSAASSAPDGGAKRGIVVVYGTARSGPEAGSPPAPGVVAADRAALGDAPAARAETAPASRGAGDAGERMRATLQTETMPGSRRAPLAAFMVPAGTPIAAQLDVAVESDLPGPVVAHLVRDVLDPRSGDVLIPAGSKAIGEYTGLAGGQSRLSLIWHRLLFPDQSSFALDKGVALDEEGRVGLGGAIDDHAGALIRRSVFSGLLSEIARRIGMGPDPRANTLVLINTGAGSQAGLPEAILAAADRLNQRDASQAPVVTIEANAIFSLYVDRDMLFDAPYAPMTSQGQAR